ncbi:MAG: DUF790 family protein [Pyrinomonadaceae bacterium]
MLTADLAMNWQRGGKTGPRLLDPRGRGHLQEAADLVALFQQHVGRTRGELEQTLQEYVGVGTDYRILRGLIKLLTDRCEFQTGVKLEPSEIRRAVFLKARESHPLAGERAAGSRAEVLAAAAAELQCAPDLLSDNLYADLPKNQKLIEFEELSAEELLDRYNLAQAQALLYRCLEMRLWVAPQEPEGYRELFDAIKAYRLIHTVKGSNAGGYEIRLDGPVSLFQRSQKYGVQMAVFLPALLLCRHWRLSAEITAGKPGQQQRRLFFELDSETHALRTHYLAATPYQNPVIDKLAADWTKRERAWALEANREVIDLGASAFVPDYVLCHPDGRQVYLEIFGFWTSESLQARVRELEQAGLRNFLVAAWEELRGSRDPLAHVPPRALVFKKSLDPAAVELAAEALENI